MIIKAQHPHVYSDGLIHTNYLDIWNNSTSNLTDLLKNLSSLFSAQPPLFQKPKMITQQQTQNLSQMNINNNNNSVSKQQITQISG